LDFLDDGADVGGERIGGLATDLDGRFPGCGEAGTTELDAAALGGGQGGRGALADCCPLVLGDGGEDVDGKPVGSARLPVSTSVNSAMSFQGPPLR